MKNILLLSIPVLLFSCSGLDGLTQYRKPIDYLHNTEMAKCDKGTPISFGTFENQVFADSTSLETTEHKVLPLIIYNYQRTDLAVTLGQSSIEQNYSDFFKESFKKESQRTGCYFLTDEKDDDGYVLGISFVTCQTKSRYQQIYTLLYLVFGISMSVQEIGYPSQTDLILDVKLIKGNTSVFEKTYSVIRAQPFINTQTRNVEKLRSDFVTNMVESLSLSTKEGIERIIKDINLVVQNVPEEGA